MRRFMSRLAFATALVVFLGACAALSSCFHSAGLIRNPSLNIMVDSTAQIPKSGAYSWGPHFYRLSGAGDVDLEKVDQRLRGAIKRELARRGYQEGSEGSPLIVGFAAGLNAGLDDIAFNESYGDIFNGAFPTAPPGENRAYAKGALVIDVLDAKTRKLLWRGAIIADVAAQATEQQKDRRVSQGVQALLDNFPVPRAAR
jgi:hypothetical protein